MVELTKLWDPSKGQLRVVGLMSGSGTNLRKIIEHELELISRDGQSPFHVPVIFTNNSESNAVKIGNEYSRPVVVIDSRAYAKSRGKKLKEVREDFDKEVVKALASYDCSVAAYAGYMLIASPVLVNAFLGVNVHPADLTIMDNGKRRFTGDNAVLDALVAGQKEIRATTHLITEELDGGPILMVSRAVKIGYDIPSDEQGRKSIANDYQDLLKRKGDWEIFPKTIEDIARGRFSRNEQGIIYYEGFPKPKGVRLD